MECKYSARCGGCEGISQDVSVQLQEKGMFIRNLFNFLPEEVIEDCVGDYYPYKYRNKIHLAFGELKGKTIIGFFEDASTKITDVEHCVLFGEWATKLIAILREFVSRFKIRPINKFGEGIIRYAHARHIDGKLQLTLVVTTPNFAGRDWLYDRLKKDFAEVSFYININRRTDHSVFDKSFKFVKGSRYLDFNFCGVKVSLSPNSFLQVNLSMAEKMYKQAVEMLDISSGTTVVDLYSGIGITSILFGRKASRVIAIEEVEMATENAKYMAKLNGLSNVYPVCGKCEEKISEVETSGDVVVFVDPARAGMEKSVIDAILRLKPRMIVYMSCNPETCARDIKYIVSDTKYQVSVIKPYNMFPYTKHIETLVCLQRQV